MMKSVSSTVLFTFAALLCFAMPSKGLAQVMDPAFFSAPTAPAPVENSYYIKKSKPKKTKKRTPAQETKENEEEKTETVKAPTPTASPTPAPATAAENQGGFTHKVRDLFLGGDPESLDKYRQELAAEDIRKNIFDFTVATQYFYNSSQSNYFYRNYINSSPGALVGLDLWMTPFLAIDVDYRFSLLNSIKDSPTQDIFTTVTQDWLNFGLKFRRFFNSTASSSSLDINLKYVDHQFTVPTGSNYRLKTRTRGPDLSFDLSIASSRSYFWNFGFNIAPYLTHDETPGTSDFRTGQSNQAMGFGAYLGGEYRMTRQTRTFFKFSTELYRSQFSGTSNGADPVTGTTISNASVNDVFYFFDIGFKFGR